MNISNGWPETCGVALMDVSGESETETVKGKTAQRTVLL